MSLDEPFQRISVGTTFSRVFTIFKSRVGLFLSLSVALFIPMVAMSITIAKVQVSSMSLLLNSMNSNDDNIDESTDYKDPSAAYYNNFASSMGKYSLQLFIEYIALVVFVIVGKAAICSAAIDLFYAGKEETISWKSCMQKGFQRFCHLFCPSLIVGLGIFVAHFIFSLIFTIFVYINTTITTLLGIMFAIAYAVFLVFVMVSLMILTPIVMVEGNNGNNGPIQFIKRCWELSWNHRCYIFCTVFCLYLGYYGIQIFLSLMIMSIGDVSALYSGFGVFIMMVPFIVLFPLIVIIETIVYFNIRVEREGMNHQVLMRELNTEEQAYESVNKKAYLSEMA